MGTSLVGKNLANYRICGRLGSGGVGQVWRAVDTVLGRTVAVKALRPELAGHSQMADRFRAEAQTLARLNHPNIATLHCLVEEAGQLYMVLEHVEGQTFAQLLRVRGALEIDRAFELFHPALDGLEHAHEAGVIHRDVKPSNLMVDARGLVKVMDFGIARLGGSERVTRTGHLVGTPEYMSPEQIRGEDVTVRSDVYSLGLLLYALLAGRPPFQREGEFDVMRAQVEGPPPPLSDFVSGVPESLERAMLRALEKDPAARYASVAQFRDALVSAGAPERTNGQLPAWVGAPDPPTQAGAADSDATTEQREDATTARSQATTLLEPAPGPRRVGRWQHAAVGLLMLSMSLGASSLHLSPAVPEKAPIAPAPELQLAAPDAGDSPSSEAAAGEPAKTRPVRSEPAEPEASPSLARRRPARDDPPALEETGWVIRR